MRAPTTPREKGATLVEFAIVFPVLITLLIGLIEFGWLFARNVDVGHAAREGARLAAVNFPSGPSSGSATRIDADRDALIAEICERANLNPTATVTLASSGAVDDPATVTVTSQATTLTGFLDWAIPGGTSLEATAETRLEQPATWTDTAPSGQACP